MPAQPHLGYIAVCSVYPEADEEDLSQLIEGIQSLSEPGYLPQRDVYIESGDFDDYTVVYSNGKPESPSKPMDRTVIKSDILEDDVFHVHSFIEPEHKESVLTLHEQMWGGFEEIELSVLSSIYEIDSTIGEICSSIGISIDEDNGIDLNSIELSEGDFGFSVNKNPDGLFISVVDSSGEEVGSSDIKAKVEDHLEASESRVNELIS